MAAAGKVEDKWTEHKDENGKTYYYNFARKQGVWEKPEGFQSEEQSTAGMEVEDSSEQEGFRPVAKAKRKKSTETKVDDGLVVKKLLDSNKFSPLAEKNKNNNNADPAGGKTEPVVPTYGKPPGGKKQPPLVVQNTSLSHLGKVLGSCEVQPDLKLTRTGIKLTCYSGDDFDTVQAHLKKHKVQFYTYGKRCDRAHRKDNRTPTVPVFKAADFPPLPGPVPVVEKKQKHPRPAGSNQGQPHPGGNEKQHPRPGKKPGPHPGGAKEEKDEEVLYSSAELWDIYLEFSARLKRCITRSDQGKVMVYLLCKFEVN